MGLCNSCGMQYHVKDRPLSSKILSPILKVDRTTPDAPSLTPGECYPSEEYQISEKDLQNKNLECCICLGIVKNPVIDKCGHIFGEECIKRWLTI